MAKAADEPAPLAAPATPAAVEAVDERPVPSAPDKPSLTAAPAEARTGADWPGFRGPDRNDIVRGVRINTDWTASPPVELWRRPIGPGWSSFAVQGDLLYTQEQRGDDEMVSSYKVTTGQPVWRHHDTARFWEANAGPGPRGTPTLSHGRVYTFGGTGILNALDANNGAVVWSRNAATDSHANLPDWGFSSSPLVVGDLVIVAASGTLVAYDRATGEPRWSRPAGGEGYSSPQLLTIGGVAADVQLSGDGAIGVAPDAGTLLWEHAWPGFPIVQPAQTEDGDVCHQRRFILRSGSYEKHFLRCRHRCLRCRRCPSVFRLPPCPGAQQPDVHGRTGDHGKGRLRDELRVVPRQQRRRWRVRPAAEGRGIPPALGRQVAGRPVHRHQHADADLGARLAERCHERPGACVPRCSKTASPPAMQRCQSIHSAFPE